MNAIRSGRGRDVEPSPDRRYDVPLGDLPDTFWDEYSGRIDDVRGYDYQLPQSEINAIYQQGR